MMKIKSGRNIPGRCVITIDVCGVNDATQSHIQEMHGWIETY